MYIPSMQSLPPHFFFKTKNGKAEQTFPFNQNRSLYFYFARNGIYYLGQKLKKLGYDRILFPAYNHGNEIRALLASGITLDYYNINEDTSIDFDELEQKLKEAPAPIYFIHYVGFPQDSDRLMTLKQKWNVLLIEDNALGLFSKYGGKALGQLGDASIFCLYKTLPIPNGGVLCINNPDLSVSVSLRKPQLISTLSRMSGQFFGWLDLRFNGLGRRMQNLKSRLAGLLDNSDLEPVAVLDSGFNTRSANWTISGLSQFIRLRTDPQQIAEKRRTNFEYMLHHIPERYQLFHSLPEGTVPWFFPAVLENRESVFRFLTSQGVDCARFWRIAHEDIPADNFPHVARLRERVLELPIHQDLSQIHLDYVIDQFNRAVM